MEIIISTVGREVFLRDRENLKFRNNLELEYILQNSQSHFFQAAFAAPEIKSVGFTELDREAIPRSKFLERSIPPHRLPEQKKEVTWAIQVSNVVVWSPNFQESDQNSRKWKGIVTLGGVRHFTIEDKAFWIALRSHEIVFDDATELTVQWGVGFENGKEVTRKALRILKINGTDFGKLLSESEAFEILNVDDDDSATQLSFGLFKT
jgi:hypothetical protein